MYPCFVGELAGWAWQQKRTHVDARGGEAVQEADGVGVGAVVVEDDHLCCVFVRLDAEVMGGGDGVDYD
jgi:hypothetical protein